MSDYDPRLASLYDVDNPDGPDHDFYRGIAARVDARRIIDLGCGTGLLTVTLTGPGRQVTGIDPSATMLALARTRPGAGSVTWLDGDSSEIGQAYADLVVMTGNVAQHLTGPAWPRALADIAAGLRPGGTLAFEMRNPRVRAWESWAAAPKETRETAYGPLTEWLEIEPTEVAGEIDLLAFNRFEATGELVVERQRLAFRSEEQVRADLSAAGLEVQRISGSWSADPFTGAEPLLIVEAVTPRS